MISTGTYVELKLKEYDPEISSTSQVAPILLIVVGVVILIVSFLGCCGAIKENSCLLCSVRKCCFVIFSIRFC